MDQKNINNSKKLPTPLKRDTLRQVKGGYRETIGVRPGSQSVRWDEIDIRFDDDTVSGFLTGGPQGNMLGAPPQTGLVKRRP